LIDFLAFLVQTLRPKKTKCVQIPGGFPQLIFGYFAIKFEPEMLQSQSNPLKARIIAENSTKSNKTLSHHIGSIVELP